jgi:hypothetical protein
MSAATVAVRLTADPELHERLARACSAVNLGRSADKCVGRGDRSAR